MLSLQLCARKTTFKGWKTAIYVPSRCVVVYVSVRGYHPEISLLTRTLGRAVILCRPYHFGDMLFPFIDAREVIQVDNIMNYCPDWYAWCRGGCEE